MVTLDKNSKEIVSVEELCKFLSISKATAANWIRLGKIFPSEIINGEFYFSKIDVLDKLNNENDSALKSRRNKKFLRGNNIYKSYISNDSSNIQTVYFLINYVKEKNIDITVDFIVTVLADCAIKLLSSGTMNIENYLSNSIGAAAYKFLIDDLVIDKIDKKIIEQHPQIFSLKYFYVENEDLLGLIYISLSDFKSRKTSGSYYTPTKTVKKLCEKLFSLNNYHGKTIYDPCCGGGNFILQLPKEIKPDYIYANDIDPVCVKITRINFALKYKIYEKSFLYSHVTNNNYLTHSNDYKYDFIIGNPPWGYDFSDDEKIFLRKKYISASGKNIESYDVFIEESLNNLKICGVLSFIIPEAFLNVKIHTPIREKLLAQNSVKYLEFLGECFDNVQCPSIIIQIKHTAQPLNTVGTIINDGNNEFEIKIKRAVSADNLTFYNTDEEYRLIDKLENTPNKITLKNNADFALGIVTGDNKKYIFETWVKGSEPIVKGVNVGKYSLKSPKYYIKFEPEKFQQVAPINLYRAEEKLVYRFVCSNPVFAYDNKKSLTLNSCNILIPHIEGLEIKYIMAVLNSRISDFWFKKKFNSIKILKSHIQQFPIPKPEKHKQNRIVKLVEELLKSENFSTKLYDEIDRQISDLYNLSEEEYKLVLNFTQKS